MEPRDIAKTRRWFGYNLREMGEKIGAHYSTVSLIEAGKRKPTGDQLKKLEGLRKRAMAEMSKELAS